MCLEADTFLAKVDKFKYNRDKYLYTAERIWKHYLQASNGKQLGADGKFVKYMNGPIYALSFELAKFIVGKDALHSALYPMYGNSNEDVDMGRWVHYAEEKHKLFVRYATFHMGHSIGLRSVLSSCG